MEEERPDISAFEGIHTKLLSSILMKVTGNKPDTFMPDVHSLWPLQPDLVIVGPAATIVKEPSSDSNQNQIQTSDIFNKIKPGDILVVAGRERSSSSWGDSLSERALARGVRAAVVDGHAHDADDIKKVGLPVFCLGTDAVPHTKISDFNVQVNCAGSLVNPGDIIVLDNHGVVVVPKPKIPAVQQMLEEINTETRKTIR